MPAHGRGVRQQLDSSGCRTAIFHPPTIKTVGVLNDCTHRKLVVIDGREAS
jgi:cardiolipin synthase